MRIPIYTVLLSLLHSAAALYAQQNNTGYKIDSSIKELVDSHTNSSNGVAIGHMEIRMFMDDSLFLDTYGKEKKIDFFTMTTFRKDTIEIIGFAGMFIGFGFYLDLFKDSCAITHLAKSDMPSYKLNRSDTTLSFSLSVPCPEKSLTLVRKPSFKEGEVIEGMIELTSRDYWSAGNGREIKFRMQLKAYFKTEEKKEVPKEPFTYDVDKPVEGQIHTAKCLRAYMDKKEYEQAIQLFSKRQQENIRNIQKDKDMFQYWCYAWTFDASKYQGYLLDIKDGHASFIFEDGEWKIDEK